MDDEYLMAVLKDGRVEQINMYLPDEINQTANIVACAGGSWGYQCWMDDRGNVYGAFRSPYKDSDHSSDPRYGTPILTGARLPA